MTIRIDGTNDLIKRLTTIQQMKHVKAAVRHGAVVLKGHISRAPKVSRRKNWRLYGNSDAAARMRRGFFYHLKQGDIEVPYKRGASKGSENLEKKWTVTTTNSGWTAIVGTNVSYAPLVQDRDEQASYHAQTGWVTVQGAENLHGREVVAFIQNAIERELEQG